jgi:glycosyltransferase involved in cell wall biosynthesis
MKVAIVHDWLTGMRGGEKVLEALCELYPTAPIYTLLHFPGSVSSIIESHPIETSFLQDAPAVTRHYRHYLPLFPMAVEAFRFDGYDLIISSSHCVAKAAIPPPSSLHICYCHTPMRYIWSHYDDYFGNHRTGLLKSVAIEPVVKRLRKWDVSTVNRVHQFIANSRAVADRVSRYYNRQSEVIYPPVDVDFFNASNDGPRESFYLMVTALVPYKRIELAIQAFRRLGLPLKIAGTGPDYNRLKALASSNVEFLGRVDNLTLKELYCSANAFIQPGEEDFGISVVEALACGCPVIAYGHGGALETVIHGETGLFFNDLTDSAVAEAVDNAGRLSFNKTLMRETALRFSPGRFKVEIQSLIEKKLRSKDDPP